MPLEIDFRPIELTVGLGGKLRLSPKQIIEAVSQGDHCQQGLVAAGALGLFLKEVHLLEKNPEAKRLLKELLRVMDYECRGMLSGCLGDDLPDVIKDLFKKD